MESHNSQLARAITPRSSLFTVAHKLKEDVAYKTIQLTQVLNGGTGIFREPDRIYKERSDNIEAQQKRLITGEITVDEFLLILTDKFNKSTQCNIASFETGNVSDCLESEDEDGEGSILNQIEVLSKQLPDNSRDSLLKVSSLFK